LSEGNNEQNFNLVIDANGEIKKSQRSSTPMYFQKYILSNVNGDWVENYDTKILSSKYTLVVVGANFPHTLNSAGGTTIEAYVLGGTWRLRADFFGTTTSPLINGTWTISTLILDNSQLTINTNVSQNLGGSNSGSASTSPVP